MPKFTKGSPAASEAGRKGKPGKHEKTRQWEQLAEDIITIHAERFNKTLAELNDEDFVKIYKDILNYFRPKINHNINENTGPTEIIFQDVSKKE